MRLSCLLTLACFSFVTEAFVLQKQQQPQTTSLNALGRVGELFREEVVEKPKKKVDNVGLFLAEAFGSDAGIDSCAIADMCAENVIFEDLSSSEPIVGRRAMEAALRQKFPVASRLVVERTAGNATTGGFTWRRECVGDDSKFGLRGTTYGRVEDGELVYLREASEPLFKAGELTEKLLRAATANMEKVKKKKTFVVSEPERASDIVEYLWLEASPKGAGPEVALSFFADDIIYEDFNYQEPFVGIDAVRNFIEAFDIPGVEFIPEEISGGADACCFTWKVLVNKADGPQGVSFYATNSDNKVSYVRDIPATKPAFLQQLAALIDPKLRVFQPRNSSTLLFPPSGGNGPPTTTTPL